MSAKIDKTWKSLVLFLLKGVTACPPACPVLAFFFISFWILLISICVFIQQIFHLQFISCIFPDLVYLPEYTIWHSYFHFCLIPPALLPDILIRIYSRALCLTLASSSFCCSLFTKQVYLLLTSSICSPSFIRAKCSGCWSVLHPSLISFFTL